MCLSILRHLSWPGSASAAFGVCAALFAPPSEALGCFRDLFWSERIITLNLGSVEVPPGIAVGSVIKSWRFDVPIAGATKPVFKCLAGGTTHGVYQQGGPVPGQAGVRSTTIAGIGIRIRVTSGGSRVNQFPFQHTHGLLARPTVSYPMYYTVDLVKTGTVVGTGRLAGGVYTRHYGNADQASAFTTVMGANSLTVTSPACTLDPLSRRIDVGLGTVQAKEFTGVGSTAGDRRFFLRFNCRAGVYTRNAIHVRLDAVADGSQAGVLRLSYHPRSAQGVGIRVLDAAGAPVRFGQSVLAARATETVQWLGYTAQYLQTGQTVKPGVAAGTATFTVEYK